MSFSKYLHQDRILFFHNTSKEEALRELAASIARCVPAFDSDTIMKAVWDREELFTTRIAPGIAIPHATFPDIHETYIAVGISPVGISYDAKDDGTVQLLIMLIGDETAHLKALSEVAARLQVPGLYDRIVNAQEKHEVFLLLTSTSTDFTTSWEAVKLSRMICRQALELAKAVRASVVVVHSSPDSLMGMRCSEPDIRMLYVSNTTEEQQLSEEYHSRQEIVFNVPFQGLNRSSKVEITLLLALSKGLLKKGERVVSVFGLNAENRLDTIVFTDIKQEFSKFFSISMENSDHDIEQQVFIRVLQLASEIAHEGREGKAVGTLFVVGDNQEVSQHCQQMIANPFKGYQDHERNILDPGLTETIKEFAQLDGAIIIKGNGVIASAGTYLRVRQPIKNFPHGLGARHASAAGITAATASVAIAVSESTRKLSLFSSGERIMEV